MRARTRLDLVLPKVRRRQRRSHLHPRFENGYLGRCQPFVVRRHLQVFVLIAHSLDQQTVIEVAGRKEFAGIAALEQPLLTVEQQSAFYLLALAAVALITLVCQQRANLTFKELDALGIAASKRSSAEHGRRADNQP